VYPSLLQFSQTACNMNINSDTGLPSPLCSSDEEALEYTRLRGLMDRFFSDGTLLDQGDPEGFLRDIMGYGYPSGGPAFLGDHTMEVMMGTMDGAALHPAIKEHFSSPSYPFVDATRARYSDNLEPVWLRGESDSPEEDWEHYTGPRVAPFFSTDPSSPLNSSDARLAEREGDFLDGVTERWIRESGGWSPAHGERALSRELEDESTRAWNEAVYGSSDDREDEAPPAEPCLDMGTPSPPAPAVAGVRDKGKARAVSPSTGGDAIFDRAVAVSGHLLPSCPASGPGPLGAERYLGPVPPPSEGGPDPALSTPAYQADVVETLLTTALVWLGHVKTLSVPSDRWGNIQSLALAVEAAVPLVTKDASGGPAPPPGAWRGPGTPTVYQVQRQVASWARFLALRQTMVELEAWESLRPDEPDSMELRALRKKVNHSEAQYRRVHRESFR
jgi:hypothetical protein